MRSASGIAIPRGKFKLRNNGIGIDRAMKIKNNELSQPKAETYLSICVPFHISAKKIFPTFLSLLENASRGLRYELIISYHDSVSFEYLKTITSRFPTILIFVKPYDKNKYWESANHSKAINIMARQAMGSIVLFMDNDFFLFEDSLKTIGSIDFSTNVFGLPYGTSELIRKVDGSDINVRLYQNFPTLTLFAISNANLKIMIAKSELSLFDIDIFNKTEPGVQQLTSTQRRIIGIPSGGWWRDTGYNIPFTCERQNLSGICAELTLDFARISGVDYPVRLAKFQKSYFGGHIENLSAKVAYDF